jgi:hypothetical protein
VPLRLGRDDRVRQGRCDLGSLRDPDHPECRGRFIAGGDQSNYIRYWKDTPVEDAINFVAAKPAPIGGTSAGMAVLGEYVYSAEGKDSLTTADALKDPYTPDLTLARGFLALPRLENVITDQHLQERDRIGRTLALLSRLQQDGWAPKPHAIAADRETALHIDPASGMAEVFATADHPTPYVYFMAPAVHPSFASAVSRSRPARLPSTALAPAGTSISRLAVEPAAFPIELRGRPASYSRRAKQLLSETVLAKANACYTLDQLLRLVRVTWQLGEQT